MATGKNSVTMVLDQVKKQFPYLEDTQRLRTWVANFINTERKSGGAFANMSLDQYTKYVADYILDPKRAPNIPEVTNPIKKMAQTMFTDVLGKNGSEKSVQAWADKILKGVTSGVPFKEVSSNIVSQFRESPAYQSSGGIGGEYVRNMMKQIELDNPKIPPFVWGEEELKNARAFAEDVYGAAPKQEEDESDEAYQERLQKFIDERGEEGKSTYFADLIMQQIENAQIASTRLDEDTAAKMADINRALKNYMEGNEVSRARSEEDYNRGLEESARQLGITVDDIRTAQTRVTEDNDRKLAELEEDYERTGGRISDDKIQQMGYLLQDKERMTGRLNEDESLMLRNLERQYGKNMEKLTESINSRGLAFSGQRARETRELDEATELERQGIERSYDRQLEDLERTTGRSLEELERQASRQLEDLETSYQREQQSSSTSYERNLEDLERQEYLAQQQAEKEQAEMALQYQRGEEDAAREAGIQEENAQIAQQKAELEQTRSAEDIARELEQNQKNLLKEQEKEIETGYFGIGAQEDRAGSEWDTAAATQQANQAQYIANIMMQEQINSQTNKNSGYQTDYNLKI